MWFNILLAVAMFFFMEGVAWFTHKYVMHGFLWTWHKSHHTVRKGIFEKNDLFAIVFSLPAIVLIITGSILHEFNFLMYLGFGITGYGIFYVIFHDILVHRRLKNQYKPASGYMKRIMNAHYIHHKVHSKEGAEAFGFMYAPKKYENNKN